MTRFLLACISIVLFSCSSLKSYTTIKPNDSFVLGNNQHNSFHASLTNVSSREITVHQAPMDGPAHSHRQVAPGGRVRVKVEKNTALVVTNPSSDTAVVKLKVTGDTGLSMRYKE